MNENTNRDPYGTTAPFLVILRDRDPSPGAIFDGAIKPLNFVYLVDPTDRPTYAVVSTSGYFSDDTLGVMMADGGAATAWDVAPQSYVCIENSRDDEFHEMV